MGLFKDRTEAGKKLAEKLIEYKEDHLLVLALPRGGVPVGYEIAVKLNASLDTVVARKIGAPFHPEFGVGAIAPGDVLILDEASIQAHGIQRHDLDVVINKEQKEMERRMARYRSGEYSKGGKANTVIIVDDGLATGVSARAAIESVRRTYQPKKIIFTAPICARDSKENLSELVDKVVCLSAVDNLVAIGYWYEEFEQTTDEEVISYLELANANKI